jgi:hypothetical protein
VQRRESSACKLIRQGLGGGAATLRPMLPRPITESLQHEFSALLSGCSIWAKRKDISLQREEQGKQQRQTQGVAEVAACGCMRACTRVVACAQRAWAHTVKHAGGKQRLLRSLSEGLCIRAHAKSTWADKPHGSGICVTADSGARAQEHDTNAHHTRSTAPRTTHDGRVWSDTHKQPMHQPINPS